MATKAAYNEEEWKVLQWAVTDTMTLVSMAESGLWDAFKEASGAAKFIAGKKTSSDNLLIRDLCSDVKAGRDKEAFSNPADPSGEISARVSEAVALVAQKDEADVEAFKAFILGLAEATAEAADEVAPNEAGAIETIKAALG